MKRNYHTVYLALQPHCREWFSLKDIVFLFFRDHEWFKMDLPDYLFPQNNFDDSIVDVEAIREVCEVSFVQLLIVQVYFVSIRQSECQSLSYLQQSGKVSKIGEFCQRYNERMEL